MAHKFDSFWEIGDLAVTKSRFGNLGRLRLRLLGLLGFGRKILNLTIPGENFPGARSTRPGRRQKADDRGQVRQVGAGCLVHP